jgi:hypothetical protein
MTRSAILNFFAAEADQRAVLDFLFSSTDVRVFESYSEFDAELREFHSIEEMAVAFPLGTDQHGNGHAVLLQLWSPSVMSEELAVKRFTVDPATCNGHTFRHRIDGGGGLMQLYLGGVCGQVLTVSHFGHQSQIRAQTWDVDQGVNWEALKKLSNRVQYHIRKRLAAGKVPGCPVLAQALELAKAGYALKLATQTPWQFELQPASKPA